MMALCAAVGTGLALGSIPVAATAATLYGVEEATFRWDHASGTVTSYRVYITRDGVQLKRSTTVYTNEATISAEFGQTISIAVAAVNHSTGDLELGPRSDSSEGVLLLEEQAPLPTPDPGQDPGPLALDTPFDFDGDGRSDLLVQNVATGALRTWSMDEDEIISNDLLFFGPVAPVVAVGDFDGNGMDDVLYFLDTSMTLEFYLTGSGTGVIRLTPGWHVASSGDYDGDGRADLLLVRNTSNSTSNTTVWVLLLDGPVVTKVAKVFNAHDSWQFRTGDFDGDGTDDLLAIDSTGEQMAIALMADGAPKSIDAVEGAGAGWRVVSVGDVDADGRDDVVFRHTFGTLYAWLMAGAEIVDHGSLGSIGTGWTNVGLLDLDGDDNRDLIWRRNDGRVRVGFLDGISSMSTESITPLNNNWVFVNPR